MPPPQLLCRISRWRTNLQFYKLLDKRTRETNGRERERGTRERGTRERQTDRREKQRHVRGMREREGRERERNAVVAVCPSYVCQSFLPITSSFFIFFSNLKFDWIKLDRYLSKYRIRCLGLKCAKSYEFPPVLSKLGSGRFFTVAGPSGPWYQKNSQEDPG